MAHTGIAEFDRYLTDIRSLVEDRLIPAEAEVEASGKVPEGIAEALFASGLGGLAIGREHGGLGATMEQECRVVFWLGRASGAFRSVIGTNNGVGSQAIALAGTPEQQRAWLPELASGRLIGAFCLSEADAGSDAGALATTAERMPDGGYRLNGCKRYVTNGPRAHLLTIMARTGPEDAGAGGVSAFLVPSDTAGLEKGPETAKMGLHGSGLCDITLNDCEVPPSSLLGGVEGNGFRTAMKVLDRSRLHISALCVGACDRLLDEMTSHARHRHQFGRPLAAFQQIQMMIADSHAETEAARALVLQTASRHDLGEKATTQVAAAKLIASETAGRVADRALQVHGGMGYCSGHVTERFYRDLRLYRILEGTSEIQRLVIARNLVGNER